MMEMLTKYIDRWHLQLDQEKYATAFLIGGMDDSRLLRPSLKSRRSNLTGRRGGGCCGLDDKNVVK